MKKAFTIFTLVMSITFSTLAQKVTQGNLAFLKGETQLHFEFDFKSFKVDGKSEKAWVDSQVKSKNKEESGSGDVWKKEWETTTRKDIFEKKVIEDFNKETNEIGLEGGYFEDATYKATVKTIEIYPGYIAGPFSKKAWVTVEITFTEVATGKIMAKVSVSQAQSGTYDFGAAFVEEKRIGSAYGEAGEKMADAIIKALKKVK